MTNLDIQRQAARFAAACDGEHLDPEDAWYRWSAQHGVTGVAERHLFEAGYQAQLALRNQRRAVRARDVARPGIARGW